jgi:hypothetical protein
MVAPSMSMPRCQPKEACLSRNTAVRPTRCTPRWRWPGPGWQGRSPHRRCRRQECAGRSRTGQSPGFCTSSPSNKRPPGRQTATSPALSRRSLRCCATTPRRTTSHRSGRVMTPPPDSQSTPVSSTSNESFRQHAPREKGRPLPDPGIPLRGRRGAGQAVSHRQDVQAAASANGPERSPIRARTWARASSTAWCSVLVMMPSRRTWAYSSSSFHVRRPRPGSTTRSTVRSKERHGARPVDWRLAPGVGRGCRSGRVSLSKWQQVLRLPLVQR